MSVCVYRICVHSYMYVSYTKIPYGLQHKDIHSILVVGSPVDAGQSHDSVMW